MKKIIIITFLSGLLSCKKEAKVVPQQQNTPQSYPMSTLEQSLVGDWILKEEYYYFANMPSQTNYINNPTSCHLNLKSSPMLFGGGWNGTFMCDNGLTCMVTAQDWSASGNMLTLINTPHEIYMFSGDTLKLRRFINSTDYYIYTLQR